MPTRKRPVVYAPRALTDREDILFGGSEVWGEDRAAVYIAELDRVCARLGDYPMLGKSLEDVSPGRRCLPSGEHAVYYRIRQDGSIRISRNLHARQDAVSASDI